MHLCATVSKDINVYNQIPISLALVSWRYHISMSYNNQHPEPTILVFFCFFFPKNLSKLNVPWVIFFICSWGGIYKILNKKLPAFNGWHYVFRFLPNYISALSPPTAASGLEALSPCFGWGILLCNRLPWVALGPCTV